MGGVVVVDLDTWRRVDDFFVCVCVSGKRHMFLRFTVETFGK